MTNMTPSPFVFGSPSPELVPSYLPYGDEANNIIKWANMMSETKFYKQLVENGGKNAVVAIFLAARELGIPPMQALNSGLYIVQGRVQISSQMMGMLIRRKGHSIQKVEGSDTVCHLKGTRKDNGDTCESIFTIEQATKAGLTKNPVWSKFPARMLYSRALSNLAKELFPDEIGNASVDSEVPIEEAEVEIVDNNKEDISNKISAFKKEYNLDDKNSDMSVFIKQVSKAMKQNEHTIILNAIKDKDKFLESFNNYIKMKQEKE